ncbi:unnamed protein product [Soboliphyme baturini]|uniref:Signal peptidase complex subunit 3 n=1 Tax=Soboliphyme baturini TaxID=241478 RepID=A0A183IWJ9_9BILA|nr:unnamed protein product [Soboliphyme baturini]
MYSVPSRLNAAFAYTISVLSAVTFCCFLSTAFRQYSTSALISSSRPIVKHLPDYSAARDSSDLGYVNFNVEVDLTPLFDWNVKQLFLFLTAEYETTENVSSFVMIPIS